MKPVFLDSKWQALKNKLPLMLALIIVSVVSTKPNSIVGVLIAISTVAPLFLCWLWVTFRWQEKFGGSKLLEAVYFLLLAGIVWLVLNVAVPHLLPYVGAYFA
jgi:hypothetical protein